MKVIEHLPSLPPSGSHRAVFTRAYYARNTRIAEDCEILVAFVSNDRKGGTEHTIREARRLKKKVVIL